MAMTPKEQRNGITGATPDSPRPQPLGGITEAASVQAAAEAAAMARKGETLQMFQTPAGSGPSSASSVEAPERTVGAGGSLWEWDAGLAVREQSGEA